MISSSILCILSSIAVFAVSAVNPPGSYFNLSAFKLQLPLSDGNGGVVEIDQPQLETYSSAYFYTDPSDNGMTFWCPENGAHTSGSNYPRSELRDNTDFTFSGLAP